MPDNLLPLAYVLAFIAVVLPVQAVLGRFVASRVDQRRVNRRLEMLAKGAHPQEVYERLVRRPDAPTAGGQRLRGLHEAVWNYCRQAGMTVAPARLALMVLGAAGGLWLFSFLILRATTVQGLVLNGVLGLVGALGLSVLTAWLVISHRRRQRMMKLEEQLPLALDIVNRALRVGHPVISAVHLAATELGDPIGSEFGLIVDETTYGAEFKDALTSFARRTGSADAHFFAVSISIQSETGGNLVQILESLSGVIRSRHSLAKRVKALASEGKASALILSLLPVFVIGVILVTQPQFYSSKFADPVFWPIVAGIICLYLIGQLVIRRIINFKY